MKFIKKIFTNPQLRTLALYGMLTYLPITVLGVGWGKDFIMVFFNTTYDADKTVTGISYFGRLRDSASGGGTFTFKLI